MSQGLGIDECPVALMERTKGSSFFSLCHHGRSRTSCERRGLAEGPIDYFHEVSLFTQDEALVLRHGEIIARLRI
jgi:hypothetical protein